MSNKANKGSFRIISGKYKGRKFEFLPSSDLRPTPDRLRETLVNWLGQVIDRKTCLDLFSLSCYKYLLRVFVHCLIN